MGNGRGDAWHRVPADRSALIDETLAGLDDLHFHAQGSLTNRDDGGRPDARVPVIVEAVLEGTPLRRTRGDDVVACLRAGFPPEALRPGEGTGSPRLDVIRAACFVRATRSAARLSRQDGGEKRS